jgi:hypothetical protein
MKKILFILLTFLFIQETHAQCCNYTLVMFDSYGDGWNGGYLTVSVNGNNAGTFFASGYGSQSSFSICNDDAFQLNYTAADYENENSYSLYDASWNLVFSNGPYPSVGNIFTGIANCNSNTLPGNHPCNSIPMDIGTCVNGSNVNANNSGFNPGCANFSGADQWYSVVVPVSGNLTFSTSNGSLNDTGLAVWRGGQCSSVYAVACDDDSGDGYFSLASLFDMTPGETLYIQVFGYGGATGTFELCANDMGVINFDSSELPIVLINTQGQTIVQDTKINCTMEIKYNGFGNLTFVNDSANVYNGTVGIEIRGASSSGYPQTPYAFETRNADGTNNNVSILGMPAENDWVLLSNYNDRSMLRNALAFQMFGGMGNYSVRSRLVEVRIDSSYKGIYLLAEKIKRDSIRVDIANLTPLDLGGDSITGGYILQQNLWNWNNSFQSNYSPIDHPGFDIHFIYQSPNELELLQPQKDYIASFIDSLETALYSADFADPELGYRKYLDTKSFIDYLLVNEVSRNADGFKKSVFFNKDKNSNGGKLKAGPVWDFDWAWKNLYGCSIYENIDGSGWAHLNNDCGTDNYGTGYYVRLLQDTTFQNELRCDYEYYRTNVLDTAIIFANIEFNRTLLQNAQARHFQRWPLLGVSGPAPEIGAMPATYNAELDTLKAWISQRIAWLDENIPGHCLTSTINDEPELTNVKAYPNPASNSFKIQVSPNAMGETYGIYDITGNCMERGVVLNETMRFNSTHWPSGMYFVRMGSQVVKVSIVREN